MTTSDRILAHPAPVGNSLPAYLAARLDDPRKLRNRRLLCQALSAGITIVAGTGQRSIIQSAGARYTVRVWTDADGARHETCSCQWGRVHGAVVTFNLGTRQVSSNDVLPCKHQLVRRFWSLAPLDRAALLIEDGELRRAFLRGARAAGRPDPVAAQALQEVAA